MLRCIYCLESKPPAGFTKEHIIPIAFGRFRNNLTLTREVCGDCNQYFSGELELHLGRDTVDGLDRFRIGVADQADYKPQRRNSSLTHQVDAGFLKGAVVQVRFKDGAPWFDLIPQVGIGSSPDGPFTWFPANDLPERKALQAFAKRGFRHVYLCDFHDPGPVMKELADRGVPIGDLTQRTSANWSTVERIETRGILGTTFARAISKICFNYLVKQYGAEIARLPAFDPIRRFIRYGERVPWKVWGGASKPVVTNAPNAWGHSLGLDWQTKPSGVLARLCFHGRTTYQVILALSGFLVAPVDTGCAHFFDLTTLQVVELQRVKMLPASGALAGLQLHSRR